MASIRCGHCKGTHASVIEVRHCAKSWTSFDAGSPSAQLNADRVAAPAQSPYSLRSPGESPTFAAAVRAQETAGRVGFEVDGNGQPLDYLSRSQHVQETDSDTQDVPVQRVKHRAEEGMYRKSGSIYRVVKAVHGSGLTYAQRLTETASINAKNGKPKFKWEMARGFVFELRTEHLLSLDAAKEFGKLYGTCCVCGRILTNPDSISAGIGPVCAAKF